MQIRRSGWYNYEMFIALLLTLFITQQPATPVCDQLTNEEVTGLIGPIKSKRPLFDNNNCVWGGDQRMLTIVRTADVDEESGVEVLAAVKRRVQKDDVAVDEPGIGNRAVSEVIGRGHRVAIVGIAGTTAWTIGVDHVYSGLKPEELLPKLRVIAKKLVK